MCVDLFFSVRENPKREFFLNFPVEIPKSSFLAPSSSSSSSSSDDDQKKVVVPTLIKFFFKRRDERHISSTTLYKSLSSNTHVHRQSS